jgi:Ca-activated chloride channel family protein
MEARDLQDPEGDRLDRLEAVKLVLDDFISRRESDRIGLVVFGGQAFLQAPFTLDHEVSRQMLAETRIGMAGPQTVIGDAIGLALKAFEGSETEDKVLVLLTDGNDTDSKIPPPTAADLAAKEDITIHTVAIGDPETEGEERVDLQALQDIAAATGGRAFRGEDREGLEAIYRELDALEPVEVETLSYRPRRPLYFWPLGVAVLLIFGYHLLMGLRAGARALRTRHRHAGPVPLPLPAPRVAPRRGRGPRPLAPGPRCLQPGEAVARGNEGRDSTGASPRAEGRDGHSEPVRSEAG